PGGQRQHDGGGERESRDLEVGEGEVPDLPEPADPRAGDRVVLMEDEIEGPGERVQDGCGGQLAHPGLTRRHGVSTRWAPTRIASKPIAIRIAMPPAVMTPVRKVMFDPATIWDPRPPPPANTASVASATVETVAIRSPPTISGSA